ncbi:MAG TPA: universal stress protein [Acetobacteraceae bacterium]|nr:universal stress protein [Acetobacteraceae bacterium]
MPRIVLLPVSGSTADPEVFAMALAVARLFDSHLVALHVRPDVRRDIASLAASDGGMTSGIDTLMEQMETDADKREKAASDGWHAFCSQNKIAGTETAGTTGLTAEWVSEVGVEADWLAEYGRTADLIVVGRGQEKWGPDYVLMEAALMDTGKPVLIAPRAAGPAMNGVVGIAWKDTRESAGAVRAAMLFLEAAAQVIVFIVPEGEDGDKSHLRLVRMLRWHNANITIQSLHGEDQAPAALLQDAAMKAGCGLLVMGGYGHTRLREAVFGGFTRAMLEAAPLPVLMAH